VFRLELLGVAWTVAVGAEIGAWSSSTTVRHRRRDAKHAKQSFPAQADHRALAAEGRTARADRGREARRRPGAQSSKRLRQPTSRARARAAQRTTEMASSSGNDRGLTFDMSGIQRAQPVVCPLDGRVRRLRWCCEQPVRKRRSYSSERISCVRLSTTTGLSKYVTEGSVPYFSRTKAFQLSVYIASASAREFQR